MAPGSSICFGFEDAMLVVMLLYATVQHGIVHFLKYTDVLPRLEATIACITMAPYKAPNISSSSAGGRLYDIHHRTPS